MIYRLLSAFLILFILNCSQIAFSQKFKRFDAKAYPPQRFQVSHRDYSLGQYTIRIIHVKRKSAWDVAPPVFSVCRAWIEVRAGGRILHQVYFRDIDAVGGSYGIFLPQNQPFKDLFITKKEGDYDGRLLMVDKYGNLFNFPGGGFGGYFITADKKFIIGEHEMDDGSTVLVVDIAQRKVVIDGEKQRLPYPGQWYADRLGYFYTEDEENNPPPDSNLKTATIYRLDLKHLKVTKDELPIEQLNSAHKIDDAPWKESTDCTSEP